MSPIPFHCHECDKPTVNKAGICDDCESEIYAEGLRTLKLDDEEKKKEYFQGTRVPKEKEEE